jgi:hypothetical protein
VGQQVTIFFTPCRRKVSISFCEARKILVTVCGLSRFLSDAHDFGRPRIFRTPGHFRRVVTVAASQPEEPPVPWPKRGILVDDELAPKVLGNPRGCGGLAHD